jgi:signal transduction histidine kinase
MWRPSSIFLLVEIGLVSAPKIASGEVPANLNRERNRPPGEWLMKISDWMPNGFRMPSSRKQEVLLFSALFLINCLIFSQWTRLGQVPNKPWLPLPWLYGLFTLLPLVWRDRAPVMAFAIQWIVTMAAWPFMPIYAPVVGILVALYAVSVHRNRTISLLVLLASFIPNGIAAAGVALIDHSTLTERIFPFIADIVFLYIMAVGVWFAGRVSRAIRQHVQHLEREREKAREVEVLATERRRISRELHDIVSHAVTAIVLQAAGATRIAKTDFTQVMQSLANIEATGKQAMTELRQLLRLLEASGSDSRSTGIGELGPQPGLADMTVLLTTFQAAGMPVTIAVEGAPRNLERSLDLAAYRVLQEGLTNALKHAGKDSNPRLRLVWEAESLFIQIDNDANLAEAHRGQELSIGRGLVGLRERVDAAGGSLHAGPHQPDGYRLTTTIPYTANTPGPPQAPTIQSDLTVHAS